MVVLRNATDAYVSEAHPNRNASGARRLYLQATGGNQRYAYIFFSRPFPLGVTILSAKFRVYNGTTIAAGSTLYVNRISEKWSVNRITWNNKPSVISYSRKQTMAAAAAPGTQWEIDVKSVMQTVSDGGMWYGFRITIDDGASDWFYSADGPEEYRPTLEIEWSDAPDAPSDLHPAGGRVVGSAKPTLRFDFTDVSGDTDMASCQVQINATNDFSAPSFDSGEVATNDPELDLSATAYAGLGSGSTAWWRVRVKDGAGLWSDWSEAESFVYKPLPVVTLNNPPVGGTVEDTTPPIFWSTDNAQRAYQVIVSLANSREDWLWTSGKITSTDQTITLPKKVIRRDDTLYNVRVRAWDNENRESTPDANAFGVVSRDFTYNYDPTTDPVTSLVAAAATPYPWIDLTWSRASAPDKFEIWRDGEVIDVVLPDDVFTSGTSYKYTDRLATQRYAHDYKVTAVIGNKASSNNTIVSATPLAASTWLMDSDGTKAIMLLNQSYDITKAETSAVFAPLGNTPPVLVMQNVRGYEGSVTGILADEAVPGLSARQMRDRFKKLRKMPGEKLILINVDQSIECFIYNATFTPISAPGGHVDYKVSFNFAQTDLSS